MTARFTGEQRSDRGIHKCAGCGAFDIEADSFVYVAPRGRTYRWDGWPEEGWEPRKIPALVAETYCRTCALHSERTQEHSARESALPKQGGIKE